MVIVLLIIAIVFSVLTLVMTFSGWSGGNYVAPVTGQNGGSSGVSLVILPNFVLGVLYG